MRARRWMPLLLAGAALVITGMGSQRQAPGGGDATEHPEVEDAWETCDGCHREITPEIVDAWYAGAHGLNNVKCFVCHGPTSGEFTSTPTTERCISCHGGWVETMNRDFMAGKDCWSCHEPHALSPHLGGAGGGQR